MIKSFFEVCVGMIILGLVMSILFGVLCPFSYWLTKIVEKFLGI